MPLLKSVVLETSPNTMISMYKLKLNLSVLHGVIKFLLPTAIFLFFFTNTHFKALKLLSWKWLDTPLAGNRLEYGEGGGNASLLKSVVV